jgi:hypothetical protein
MNDGAMPQKPSPSTETPPEKNQAKARGEKHEADRHVREKPNLNGTANGATVNWPG